MSIYFSLNNKIDCNRLCKEIGKFVNKFNKDNGKISDHILIISIQPINNTTNRDSMVVPKIEYKNDEK